MSPHFCQVLLLAVAVWWWWHKCCGGVVCRSSTGGHLQPATSRASVGPHLGWAAPSTCTLHLAPPISTHSSVSLLSSAQLMCLHFPGPQPFVSAEDAGDDWLWVTCWLRQWGRGHGGFFIVRQRSGWLLRRRWLLRTMKMVTLPLLCLLLSCLGQVGYKL